MAKILKGKYVVQVCKDRVQNRFTYITFKMHNKDHTRMQLNLAYLPLSSFLPNEIALYPPQR